MQHLMWKHRIDGILRTQINLAFRSWNLYALQSYLLYAMMLKIETQKKMEYEILIIWLFALSDLLLNYNWEVY
jgi:hypothetical protein